MGKFREIMVWEKSMNLATKRFAATSHCPTYKPTKPSSRFNGWTSSTPSNRAEKAEPNYSPFTTNKSY